MELTFDEQGLIPGIVQDARSGKVLMLGYLSRQSFEQTLETKKVTFFSRSRNEIWVKGETSGNFLHLQSWSKDCDSDAILIQAIADGPTCHTGSISCFKETGENNRETLANLEAVIDARFTTPKEGSYIQSLQQKGIEKIAQKVGEEGVEVVIEALRDRPDLFLEESADLLFHFLVLLRAKEVKLDEVLGVLKGRVK